MTTSIRTKTPSFYRNNDPADFPNGAPINTGLNGLTTVLYADVFASLNPSKNVHQIKLAIADTGNPAYNSAVFIQGSSFTNAPPPAIPEAENSTSLGIEHVILAE